MAELTIADLTPEERAVYDNAVAFYAESQKSVARDRIYRQRQRKHVMQWHTDQPMLDLLDAVDVAAEAVIAELDSRMPTYTPQWARDTYAAMLAAQQDMPDV